MNSRTGGVLAANCNSSGHKRLSAFAVLVALSAGAALPFAFAPYNLYVLSPLSIAVLFHLCGDLNRRSATIVGFVFGLGYFGCGVWWIQISVHQFGLPVYVFSIAITAVFIIGMSLYPALFGYLTKRIPARQRIVQIVVLAPILWTISELLRGWLFTGFPWLLLGYSQIDSPLSVFAPLFGVYGVSYFVALVGAAVVLAISRDGTTRSIGITILLGIAVVTFLLRDASWTTALDSSHRVALVQGSVPQHVKWNRNYRQPSIDLYAKLSEPHWGKSLIVWPETAIPAFSGDVKQSIKYLTNRAVQSGSSLIVGMPSGTSFENAAHFNSVVQFGRDSGQYDKRHLVPFGEYLPLDRWLRPITAFLRIPMSNFSSGQAEQNNLIHGELSLGVSICYEDAYAHEVARSLPDANVLINVSNDAWFGDSIAPHQHLQIARMRALETERYLLRATNTGVSALINGRGELEAVSDQFTSEVVSGTIVPRVGMTPFTRFGSIPIIAFCALTILALVAFNSHALRRRP
ncbi:MAG: apolipoprotein N-acyltransferase [Gammaproteobacteria bacterium]